MVERSLAKRGLTITPTMSLGSTEAIKHAVAAGVGVAIVSKLAVSLELAAGRLKMIRANLKLSRPIYHVTNAYADPSPAAKSLSALLAMNLSDKR